MGQDIAIGDPLAEVETEKAVVEYAAEVEGKSSSCSSAEGRASRVGEPIAVVGAPGETALAERGAGSAGAGGRTAATAEQAARAEPETAPEQAPSPVADARPSCRGDAAPQRAGGCSPPRWCESSRRSAGIDLARVTGTGPGGRIVRRDLERLPLAAAPPAPAPQPHRAPSQPAPRRQPPTARVSPTSR